jgi:redox-sensitive bicupin YhaK (pirin superfamily)
VPSYEQKAIGPAGETAALKLSASPDSRDGSLTIHQDAGVYLGWLDAGRPLEFSIGISRQTWIQLVRGSLEVGEQTLNSSDGAAVNNEPLPQLRAVQPTGFLFFDLP